ncbi:MAG: hypothetical protein J6V36_05205, partial [Clostridia bacterium]|nr:hypothetical protein [Clostridia bacterium]
MKNKGDILLGLSGGIDSEYSARLLLEEGYNVKGLYINMLKKAAESWDASETPDIKEVLMSVVPTFKLPGAVNSEAENSEEM